MGEDVNGENYGENKEDTCTRYESVWHPDKDKL